MAGLSAGPLVVFLTGIGFSTLYAGFLDAVLLAFFIFYQHVWSALFDGAGSDFYWAVAKKVVTTAAAFLAFQIFRLQWTSVNGPKWDGPGKVLLFPSRTTHSRMFPKKHSFSYSYLVAGIPVGWEGNAGGMVSVEGKSDSGLLSWFSLKSRQRKGWYDISAADYLERGKAELGLRGKLDEYLRSQGADPSSYPHAYLVTAARFLGHHFNPVSFWYLYDAEKTLAATILEVNNTFGERRMYFLTPNDDSSNALEGPAHSNRADKDEVTNGDADIQQTTVLKQSWPKDFHVSPFNSRKGGYSLIAPDPLGPFMQGTGPITSTINLVSSKGHPKLVARLIPDGPAIDPYGMTAIQKLKFLASWWWVGFVTFPRIVKEASVLFFRRNLHVWFRPEPLKSNIGRLADSTECQLEQIFRRYLRWLVEQAHVPVSVKYIPSGILTDTQEVMLSPRARNGEAAEEIELKVLTPAFYSRFVYYAHDLEAFFCELNESCTVAISRPDLLSKLALKKYMPALTTSNVVEFSYFKIIQNLRRRPERIERPLTSSALPTKTTSPVDIREFRISSMDSYVLAHESTNAKATYRNCVLKLFLADRIALGLVPLLAVQRFILQATFAWLLAAAVGGFLTNLPMLVMSRLDLGS